jgi:hypothetical protein
MSDQSRPNGQTRPDAQSETSRRVTVREAAGILGTTVEGVRSRIKRGSLDSMRVDGAVYVLLTPDQADRARPGDDQALHRLVDEQREMIDWLKREVERKDTILMTLAQRVPELEAAPEPRGGVLRDAGPKDGNGVSGAESGQRKGFWRRFFGL